MADQLAVGLAKSVVVGAVTKIQSAIDEDARLRQKVKRDLVFISLEFEMMQSFLNDANEEMKNNLVRTWVKHIKELAYDVEDCVENVVHLDDKPIFWRRLLPSWLSPPLPLDLAVQELELLKGRVEDVNKCYRRYNKINDSVSKLVIQQQMAPAVAPITLEMLAEARGVTKREQGFSNLTWLLTQKKHDHNNGIQVISVWGAAGDDGMTSIIREAYNNPEICQGFPWRYWVKITHPFTLNQFMRNMMAQFHATSCMEQRATISRDLFEKMMEATQEDLFTEYERLFRDKRYLIVLEGLSHMVDWDVIRAFLPDTINGSWIIVSTQQSDIATLCIGHSYHVVELQKFSEEHSVCALYKGSGDGEDKGKQITVSMENEIIEKKIMALQEVAKEWIKAKNDDHVGRKSQITELVKCLGEARVSSTQVMSVLGMPGVGKSALVKNLFYDTVFDSDKYVMGCKFEDYYWVDVSHPFNMKELALECHRFNKRRWCLIVIDDVRSTQEWDMIEAVLVHKHSKNVIIVITSYANVAEHCTCRNELVFNVKPLEANVAFDLFKKQVLKTTHSYPFKDADAEEVKELISKCGGLPKLISPIAGLLAQKKSGDIIFFNQRFMHILETDPEFYDLQHLFSWMHSMVLNPPAFLKPCIFYLSIFPRGHIIRRRRLIRRWIAEGNSRKRIQMQAEENGEIFFSELLRMAIFEQVLELVETSLQTDTRMVFYKANGLIHEYFRSREMEENLVFELGSNSALSTQSRGRHLVISNIWDRDRIMYESIDFSRLWSLTVFGIWESFFISENMKLLRVIDLEDASGVKDDDVKKMVKLFRHLRFLSLRGCSDVYYLPSSLGDLRQLQTLDVRGTSIVTLPGSITKLQKLQYIRAGCSTIVPASTSVPVVSPFTCLLHFCYHRRAGVEVPTWIGKLTALHTLGVVNVSASATKKTMKELKKLNQLRKLGVFGINGKNSGNFFSAIKDHAHLESLSVSLNKDTKRGCCFTRKDNDNNQGCLGDMISLPSTNLRSLKLYGLGDKLPKWESQLFGKLAKLELEMISLPKDDIRFIGSLPELCILRVKQHQHIKLKLLVKVNGFEDDSFKKVKILEISCSSGLSVTFGSWTMKKLELLKVDCYGGSPSYKFSGLGYLEELKEVVLVNGSNAEALKKQLEDQLAEEHPKETMPVVKLEHSPPSS